MKLVSVIMPAFNAGKHIRDSIESVIAQTYSNWELIIVNDCSFDNTIEIVEEYSVRDSRIRLINHYKNLGVAAARNTALREVKGQYVAFLDCDDMWMPLKLEKQVYFMEEHGYAFSYTAYQKFYSDERQTSKPILVPARMTEKAILYNTAIACLTVVVDIEKVGAFEMPLLSHSEDQCTWKNILSRGYCAYGLNESLSIYRVSESSLSANKWKSARKQWTVYRQYYGFSILKSSVCFFCYAFRALMKHLKR